MQTWWSVKGGVGVTVLAVASAVSGARAHGSTLLVDLAGDVPAALGLAEPSGPGVADWLRSEDSDVDALRRLVVPVHDGLSLLPAGGSGGAWTDARIADFCEALEATGWDVVVDGGRCEPVEPGPRGRLVGELAGRGRSLLVTRNCYLGLRRAVHAPWEPDGVVLVREPGRPLGGRDVGDVLSLPVLAEVQVDPALARAVDAGLLGRRPQRALDRQLAGL